MHLTSELAAAIIGAQFPELRPVEATFLGEGYDSVAFDVNGRWVFRFPKRPDVERQLFIERRILPLLADRAPVPVPSFSFHGVPAAGFPRHFAGYARLAGVPAIGLDASSANAPVLGEFLSVLHAVPAEIAADLDVPRYDPALLLEEVREEALSDLHLVRDAMPDVSVGEWRPLIEAGPRDGDAGAISPVLVHGDLAAEHILVDPAGGAVTGVIDWSEIALGDPAIDFAGMWHWGGSMLAGAVLSRYARSHDPGLIDRARYFGACRGIADILFGLETARPEYISAGTRALSLCTPQVNP